MKEEMCVGLFGTCGSSKWRDPFMKAYNLRGFQYFNPVKEDWVAADAINEAWHLANDRVVLFPITGETYATGSLAETGFSILQAIRLDDRRQFVIYIEDTLIDELMENENSAKDSLRARAIVRQHLNKLNLSNVFIVYSLEKMLEISFRLMGVEIELDRIKNG